jgi:hypothetical protein
MGLLLLVVPHNRIKLLTRLPHRRPQPLNLLAFPSILHYIPIQSLADIHIDRPSLTLLLHFLPPLDGLKGLGLRMPTAAAPRTSNFHLLHVLDNLLSDPLRPLGVVKRGDGLIQREGVRTNAR